jgi:hypothetical protein
MSDAYVPKFHRIRLGGGQRHLFERGGPHPGEDPEGIEADHPDLARGAHRSVSFLDCKLLGDDYREIDGSYSLRVHEQSPNRPRWPAQPWKIGEISEWQIERSTGAGITLYVTPVTFEQFLELIDVPENDRLIVSIGSVGPNVETDYRPLCISVSLSVRPRSHPVVRELEQHRPVIFGTRLGVGWLELGVAAILALELIRWLWR